MIDKLPGIARQANGLDVEEAGLGERQGKTAVRVASILGKRPATFPLFFPHVSLPAFLANGVTFVAAPFCLSLRASAPAITSRPHQRDPPATRAQREEAGEVLEAG
jgi:hypothetical protein